MKKKRIGAALGALMILSLAVGGVTALADDGQLQASDVTYVYFEAGTAEEEKYLNTEETIGDMLDKDVDAYGNAGVEGSYSTARSVTTGAIIYDFDFADDAQSGYMSAYAGNRLKVEYKIPGGEYTVLSPVEPNLPTPGVVRFELGEQNVFAAANASKEFSLRFTSSTGAQDGVALKLSGVLIASEEESPVQGGDTVEVFNNTEEDMRYTYAQSGFGRRYDGTNAYYYSYVSGYQPYITFKFDLPNDIEDAVFTYEVNAAWGNSAALTASASADNVSYTPVGSGASLASVLEGNAEKTVYIKISAPAGEVAEYYLRKVSLAVPVAQQGGEENENPDLPVDDAEVYFYAGTAEEAKYLYRCESADAARSPMGIDGYEGSYFEENARIINSANFLLYEFDLRDDIQNIPLKILGGGSLNIEYSTDNAATFAPLTVKNAAGIRGYSLVELTEEDALSGADNRFAVKISCADGTLTALYMGSGEEIGTSCYLMPQNAVGMRYLNDAHEVNRFYAHSKFFSLYFKNASTQDSPASYVEYKFDLENDISQARLAVTYAGAFDILVKPEGGEYASVFTATLADNIGDYATNVIDISSVLSGNAEKQFYVMIRRTDSATNAFVMDLSLLLGSDAKKSGGFGVYTAAEAEYLFDTPNDAYGASTVRLMYAADKGEEVFGRLVNDSVTYRIPLPGQTERIAFEAAIDGMFSVSVSKNGTDFEELYSPALGLDGPYGFNVYGLEDATELYLRFEKSGENAFRLESLNYTTENVPDAVQTGDIDEGDRFDYDDLTGELPGELDLGEAPAAEIEVGSYAPANAKAGIIAGCVSGAVVLLAAAGVTVFAIKKRGKKQ